MANGEHAHSDGQIGGFCARRPIVEIGVV